MEQHACTVNTATLGNMLRSVRKAHRTDPLADASADRLATPVFITLAMPRDLRCLFTALAENDPGVVFRERQVHILES